MSLNPLTVCYLVLAICSLVVCFVAHRFCLLMVYNLYSFVTRTEIIFIHAPNYQDGTKYRCSQKARCYVERWNVRSDAECIPGAYLSILFDWIVEKHQSFSTMQNSIVCRHCCAFEQNCEMGYGDQSSSDVLLQGLIFLPSALHDTYYQDILVPEGTEIEYHAFWLEVPDNIPKGLQRS